MEGNPSSPTKAKSTRLRTLIKEKWAALGHRRSHLKLVSPVPHLHLSNNAPSDEEEILIRQALEDLERQRQEIRADMERKAIWELVESKSQIAPPELEHIDGFMRGLQSVLSPIRRLPPEILQAIFLVGSEGRDMRTPFLELRRNPQKCRAVGAVDWPWTLSKVCRQWRQTCIGTPSLWNYLPTMYSCPPDYPKERIWDNQVFALMIERSRGTPLSVYINATSSLPSTHHTLEMLVKESNRWEELILETTWSTYQEYINPIRDRLQRLRRLRFYFLDDDERAVPITWDAFSDSPCLQHIDLELNICGQTFFAPPSPFMTSAVHTFINNVNLQSISLAISLNVVLTSSITLPHLKRLKLYYSRPEPPITLNALILPALEELMVDIHTPVGVQQTIQPFIRTLIERSVAAAKDTFPLKKLCVKNLLVESDFLVALIDLLPNLQALNVPLTNEGWGIVHRLACTRPGVILAPNLEFCTFQVVEILSPSLYNALHLIAEARCCASLPANGRPSTSDDGLAGEMDITDAVPFKRLKVLALQCQNYNFNLFKLHQRILEEFSLSQRSDEDPLDVAPSTLGNLAYWFKVLEAHGIAIGFRLDLGHETRSLNKEIATEILKELRRCNLDDVDVKDIYIPHFHLQLQALHRYIDVNGHKVKWKGAPIVLKELRSALEETLEKCHLVLDAHIFEIHWVLVNRKILMYVPPDHPFRSSSESIKLARAYELSSNLSPFYEMFCEGTSLDDWDD